MEGADYGGWLYNGGEGGDRPHNIGYRIGYQIAEAYYDRAGDKGQAVRDLLHIRGYGAALRASGYDVPSPE